MGLLYAEFQDAIHDGAGKRVLVVWKFLSGLQATLIICWKHSPLVLILLPFSTEASRAVTDSKIY